MEEQYFYSAKINAFFPLSLKSEYEQGIGWPDDALGVDQVIFKEFVSGKQGYRRTAGENGLPCWKRVDNTPDPEQVKKRLISEADTVIQPMLGYALAGILSNTEKTRFKAWNEYRKVLEDVDVTATNIKWPAKPE